MKHFNRAFVWGTLIKAENKETENNKPYLDVELDCESSSYGRVKAFARVWGKNIVASAQKFKKGDKIKLTGVVDQYDGRNGRKTNFQIYKVDPWDPQKDKHTHQRATFILAGDVIEFKDGEDEGILKLKIRIETEGQPTKEKEFHLSVPADVCSELTAPEPGTTVKVKGRIQQDEDDCGDVTKWARPVISEIALAKNGEEASF